MMPEAIGVLLILWTLAAILGLCVGGTVRLMASRDEHRAIRIAYLFVLAGLAAPVTVPFWIGYGIRWAVLDYRRNRAELRELDR